MSRTTDRDLLFGLLALQNNFIDRDALVAAFGSWVANRSRALGQILLECGALSPGRQVLLEALVEEHIRLHSDDPEKSLAALSSIGSVRDDLSRIADPDIQASLAHVSAAHQDPDDDPYRTITESTAGTSTSEGTRFRILRPHARGGLGVVSVALDTELHREVALKQILDAHADDPANRRRFLLEAEVTGGLEHPGIVPVYGLGVHADGRPFYAMRFVRGDSLKEAIARYHADATLKSDPGRRSLELRRLLRRFTDVCHAIGYAHSRGVLHRDIKPGNVVVGPHGETLVVDWGLAKTTDRPDPSSGERPLTLSSASGSSETLPGSVLGTPAYMSPEQAQGDLDRLDPRSDVYSLGATLYSLLTGRPPFAGDAGEVLRAVQRGDFPSPRQLDPSIDRALEAVCLKAMALKAEDRYSSCRLLAEDIERSLADEPVAAYREGLGKRLARWGRRHRNAVRVAAVSLVVVALVSVAATVQIHRARQQALRLAAQRQEALVRAEDAGREEARQRAAAVAARLAESRQRAEAEAARLEEAKARRGAEELLFRQCVTSGLRLVDSGDYHGALPWLAKALPFGRHNPTWQDALRVRFASVLRQCPGLEWLSGSERPAVHAEFSPDGRRLLMVDSLMDSKGQIVISESGRGHRVVATIKSEKQVWSASFSPDSTRVVTAVGSSDEEGEARVWAVETGRPVSPPLPHEAGVYLARFSPDGRRVLTLSFDKTARLWDSATGAPATPPLKHGDVIGFAVFSPDGSRVVTTSRDKTARLWDAGSGQPLTPPLAHGDEVVHAAFSPEGLRVATGSMDRTARVWSVTDGQPVTEVLNHDTPVWFVVFSPSGHELHTAGPGRERGDPVNIRVWAVDHIGPSGDTSPRPMFARISDDARYVFTATPKFPTADPNVEDQECEVGVWDLRSAEPVAPTRRVGGRVTWADFLAAGPRVAYSASKVRKVGERYDHQSRIELWDPSRGPSATVALPVTRAIDPVLTSDGRMAATIEGNRAKFWDTETGRERPGDATLEYPEGSYPTAAAFGPDGRTLLVAIRVADRIIFERRDSATGRRAASATSVPCGHSEFLQGLSRDGRRAVIASSFPGAARVWDLETARPVSPSIGPLSPRTEFRLSPDGRWLATLHGHSAEIWDAATGLRVAPALHNPLPINHAVFSRDGRRVTLLGFEAPIILFPGAALTEMMERLTPEGLWRFWRGSISRDGRRLAIAAEGGVRVWDLESRRPITPRIAHPDLVTGAAFDPEGRRLATVGNDKTTRVWDLTSCESPSSPLDGQRALQRVVGPPGGRRVVRDLTVASWDLSPANQSADVLDSMARLLAGHALDDVGTPKVLVPDELPTLWAALTGTLSPPVTPARLREWHLREAAECEETGYWAEAARHLGILLGKTPDDLFLRLRLARAFAGLGQWDVADREYTEAFRKGARATLAWWVSEAADAERNEDWGVALRYLDKMVAADTEQTTFRVRRAYALAGLQRWDQAIADYTLLLRQNAKAADLWHARALAFFRSNRPDKAKTDLDEAVKLAPNDASIRSTCGFVHARFKEWDEAVKSFVQADMLSNHQWEPVRNEHWSGLAAQGMALIVLRRFEQAAKLLAMAGEQEKNEVVIWQHQGSALVSLRRWDEAIATLREAIRLKPDDAEAHTNLGIALGGQGKLPEAIAEFREAIRLKPDHAEAHFNLGAALYLQRKLPEAIAAYREAIRLKPDDAAAHYNLGIALGGQGKLPEAIAEYREVIRLEPDLAEAHYNLGAALGRQGKLDEAIAEYRKAIRLKPDHAEAHFNLGAALGRQGKLDEAIAEYRKVIRLKPDLAEAHTYLGIALGGQGKLPEAIAEYREAIRLKPNHAEAHYFLGLSFKEQGRFREALDELRLGHELGSKQGEWGFPSAEGVRQVEHLIALESRLPAVLRGEDKPKDPAEGLEFANLAYYLKRFGPSARLFAEVFQTEPKRAEDMKAGNRYNAACSAALAASVPSHPLIGERPGGEDKGRPRIQGTSTTQVSPSGGEAQRWRRQAIEWLRADLAHWTKQTETGNLEARALVQKTLQHWKEDTDLGGIRDETAIKALPEDEQKTCRVLWEEVDKVLKKCIR
jgi:tetratricopeptide (TPR) repeat protein/WD40 repeat protein/tRNA A-37 threonylcarbamoyl transferase component Bud32